MIDADADEDDLHILVNVDGGSMMKNEVWFKERR
jgi:hypothetical protein